MNEKHLRKLDTTVHLIAPEYKDEQKFKQKFGNTLINIEKGGFAFEIRKYQQMEDIWEEFTIYYHTGIYFEISYDFLVYGKGYKTKSIMTNGYSLKDIPKYRFKDPSQKEVNLMEQLEFSPKINPYFLSGPEQILFEHEHIRCPMQFEKDGSITNVKESLNWIESYPLDRYITLYEKRSFHKVQISAILEYYGNGRFSKWGVCRWKVTSIRNGLDDEKIFFEEELIEYLKSCVPPIFAKMMTECNPISMGEARKLIDKELKF